MRVWSLVPLGVSPDPVSVKDVLNDSVSEYVAVMVNVSSSVLVLVSDTTDVADTDLEEVPLCDTECDVDASFVADEVGESVVERESVEESVPDCEPLRDALSSAVEDHDLVSSDVDDCDDDADDDCDFVFSFDTEWLNEGSGLCVTVSVIVTVFDHDGSLLCDGDGEGVRLGDKETDLLSVGSSDKEVVGTHVEEFVARAVGVSDELSLYVMVTVEEYNKGRDMTIPPGRQ